MHRFYYGAADFVRKKYQLDQLPDKVIPLQDGTIEVTHLQQVLHGPATTLFRLAISCPQLDDFWKELQDRPSSKAGSDRSSN